MSRKPVVIKPFLTNKMDASTARNNVRDLGAAIDQIYNRNASSLSFEDLYRKAYNMVLATQGDALYEGVQQVLTKHLLRSVESLAATPNDAFLSVLACEWSSHETAFNMIKGVLLYMDKTYCPKYNKPLTLQMALQLFRDQVVYHAAVASRLCALVLDQIAMERQGLVIDRALVKDTLSMLLALGKSAQSRPVQVRDARQQSASSSSAGGGIASSTVYSEEFEQPFLAATAEFYRNESQDFLSRATCPEYLRKVEARFAEEVQRVSHYLSQSTEPALLECLDRELVAAHARTLIDMEGSGLHALLQDNKMDDLKRMYTLFGRVSACAEMLREAVGKFIEQSGLRILASQDASKDPTAFVQQIMDLKDKFDEINRESFKSDKKTAKKIKDAFESFVNRDSRCAANLASYVDDQLKASNSQTDAELEAKLEKVIVIFKFISDKDVFENYYKTLLAKRLLGGKSSSDEQERSMIAKLKAECGYQFTSKLEGMFHDMTVSDGVNRDFQQSHQAKTSPVEMDVQLLTTGYWPLQPLPPCTLPPQLTELCIRFENYYCEKNSGKKLTWMTQMGSVDIKANFPSGRKELNTSTYQSCILVLFNAKSTLTLNEIRDATGITELELRRHLLSLCTPKLRILHKASKSRGIEDNDSFTFNEEFNAPKKRIKVPLVAAKEVSAGEEGAAGESIPPAVEEDRRHLMEAAVVRTMKARKTMTHNDLIAEVTKQLSARFTPTPQLIKKRIESLIEREYMQRDPDDARLYSYLA